MIVARILFFLFLPALACSAQITFQELDDNLSHEVTIRGFLYQNSDHQWVLAEKPNLKSCCIAAERQILLSGDFKETSIGNAITLQGQLTKGSDKYHLSNAIEIPKKNNPWPIISLLGLMFIGTIIVCRKKRKPTKSAKS